MKWRKFASCILPLAIVVTVRSTIAQTDVKDIASSDSTEISDTSHDENRNTCVVTEEGDASNACGDSSQSAKGHAHFQVQKTTTAHGDVADAVVHNQTLAFASSLLPLSAWGLDLPAATADSSAKEQGPSEPRYHWRDNLFLSGGLVFGILVMALACIFCRRSQTSQEENGGTASHGPSHLHPEHAGGEAEVKGEDPSLDVKDTMTYRTHKLVTWAVFSSFPCTVFDNETLWFMMRRLLGVALLVAVIVFLCIPDPQSMNPANFSSVGTVLNVFVGLLLSFFLTSSITRWYACVNGFLVLFNSVRNLQMQLHALGVNQERSDLCVRYGVLSAWLLSYELRHAVLSAEVQEKEREQMWKELGESDEPFARMLPNEQELLKGVDDPSGLMWTWVGSLVGRMAQNGEIPPMASPTYGRIVDLAQTGQDGLRQVRSAIGVQMPFVYMHTLACIVHMNNLLAAISFGLTLGVMVGDIFININKRKEATAENASDPDANPRIFVEAAQAVIVQLFKCFVVPILYQAFLEIGISIASPFSSEDGAIPAERMLKKLHKDLRDANKLAEKPPCWDAPKFQAD